MQKRIEEVINNKILYAKIIRKNNRFKNKGVDFVTSNKDLLQLGFIKHKKNHKIKSHIHLKRPRKINYCTEVLIIESGKIKIKFYNLKKEDIKKDKILGKGDIVILFKGGHGFSVIKPTKMIEIKQGPYLLLKDKKLI
jgi:hypothetical protein